MVAVGGSFLNPFMGSSINIALPVIGREFAMDAVMLGWVATAFLLTAAMCLLPFGRLADIRGRKRLLHPHAVFPFVGDNINAESLKFAQEPGGILEDTDSGLSLHFRPT